MTVAREGPSLQAGWLIAVLIGLAGCAQLPARSFVVVPHIVQRQNMCVPTAAAMVLRYYGDEETPEHLKALAGSSDQFAGTWYKDMVSGLKRIGYIWRIRSYSTDRPGFRAGLSFIKHELSQCRPPLVST